MDRYDLTGITEDEMAEHIDSGRDNVRVFAEQPDWDQAFRQTVGEANVVYAVWREGDVWQQFIYGHALAIIKGVPWLDEQSVLQGGDVVARATFTIMVDDIEAARDLCRRYGDDMGKEVEEASSQPAPVPVTPIRGIPPRTLERLSRPLREEDLRYHPLSRDQRHPIDDEKEALLVAARKEVSTPDAIERRRAELQRLKTALDRMMLQPKGKPPHRPGRRSIQTRSSSLRPVGNFVFAALSADERASLAEQMILADGRREEPSGWHDSLGNHGISAGSGRTGAPTEDDMRHLCEDLGVFRTDSLCTAGEWGSVTEGLPCSRERLAELYGEASGISDEILWSLKESAQAHEEARSVIQALDDRRDALILAGWEVPRAHVASERWYPAPAKEPDANAQTSLLP